MKMVENYSRTASPMNYQRVQHVLIIEDNDCTKKVSLQKTSYSLGRLASNSIILSSKRVSRKHAILLYRKDPKSDNYSFWIVDGDSQGNRSNNGTFVNGKRIVMQELKHGDLIYFGTEVKARYHLIYALDSIYDNQGCQPNIFEPQKLISKTSEDQYKNTVIIDSRLQQLSNSELVRLASFPELTPHPIIEINYQGLITYVNPAARLNFKDIYQSKLKHPLLAGLLNQHHNTIDNLLVREVQIKQKVFEQYVHFLSEGQLIRSYVFDVTERKRSEQMLQYQAFHDLLTGLPNRTLFNEQLSTALANAQRHEHMMAVMFLDLDRFKNINDILGHAIGDQLLQGFAERLRGSIRSGDTVARWGGDEFTILLPQINNAEEVTKVAQRILQDLKPAFELNNNNLHISSSIGIALYPQDGEDSESLLRKADAALYLTKAQGRNNYQFYSPMMTSKASILLKLENLLHYALDQEEFLIYYQPQVNIQTGEISGMEALLRWKHPELGLVSPGQFIPLAEETGLIIPIGEWAIKAVCAQNKIWQQSGLPPIRVAVNLSARQFQQPNLVTMVAQILKETRLDPRWLELEITETTMMQNVDFAKRAMQDFQQMGVHISIDDFGTGYSSLGYLKKFPFHKLKIDRSFVNELQNNPKDTAIISTVITLGKGLNLTVVAEGVETKQQLKLLRNLKCEVIQGYYFSQPMKAEDATKFLFGQDSYLTSVRIKNDLLQNSAA